MTQQRAIRRDVGPMALMYTGLGSIIGSGWLFGAWNAAKLAGPGAIWAWVLGAAILILGAVAAYRPNLGEEVGTLILGVLSLISPWVVAFAGESRATSDALAVGVLVVALTLWSMLLDESVRGWMREHLHTH